ALGRHFVGHRPVLVTGHAALGREQVTAALLLLGFRLVVGGGGGQLHGLHRPRHRPGFDAGLGFGEQTGRFLLVLLRGVRVVDLRRQFFNRFLVVLPDFFPVIGVLANLLDQIVTLGEQIMRDRDDLGIRELLLTRALALLGLFAQDVRRVVCLA